MKRSRPHSRGLGAKEPGDPLAHLACGLVRESHRENLMGRRLPRLDKPSDATRQDASLARSGAGEDQQGTVVMRDRVPLRGIQSIEQRVVGRRSHHQ